MDAYLATICRDAGAEAFRIRGVADDAHLLVTLPRILSQANMVEGLKKKSSKWIKELGPEYGKFYWQRGCGAFSVSPSQLTAATEYVETRRNITAAAHFRKNIASSYASMTSTTMNATSGLGIRPFGSRFQRPCRGPFAAQGRLPRL
jgi:REP element-mobilizing transposase RayT